MTALALIVLVAGVPQARADSIAFAGAAGVYVWLGGTAVSRAHPVNGVVAYRVERRQPGSDAWRRVADIAAVETPRAFFAPLDSLTRALLRRALRQPSDSAVWAYIVRFPRADSLAALLGHERLRLALGFYALDGDVRAGAQWQYRVSPLRADGGTGPAVVGNVVAFPAAAPLDRVRVVRAEARRASALVVWDLERARRVRSLEVWRRHGTAGAFQPVDTVTVLMRAGDSVQAAFGDTGLAGETVYQYYAVPRDFFFNAGRASDTVTLHTVDLLTLRLPDSLDVAGDSSGLALTWRVPDVSLVRSIKVYRAAARDGPWYQVAELPREARRFVDLRATPMRVWYYRLALLDVNGGETPATAATFGYFRALDAPAPPRGVRADTLPRGSGAVVVWRRNAEPDLKGYYVYRASGVIDSLVADSARRLVSPLLGPDDTVFVDTSFTLVLGHEAAYVVEAISSSDLASGSSAPATVARGGLPPTDAPANLRATVDRGRVALVWDDLTTSAPAVAGYRVLRRASGGARAAAPDTLPAQPLGRLENHFTDSTAVAGRAYEYRVQAVDLEGRWSAPSLPAAATVPLLRPPVPGGVRAQAGDSGIRVVWGDVAGYAGTVRVYRYARGGTPQRMAEVPANQREYLDRTAAAGRRWFYYVTLTVDGRESARSDEVSARR